MDKIITVITMFLFTVALVCSYKKSDGCKVNLIETPVENTIIDSKLPEVIRQYKELLDSGVITEEEYNEKKNQLLH
ncbi:SHOCT domain-containing protein [Eubacterium sp.]